MSSLRSYFRFNKSQRNGILFLIIIITVLLFLSFYIDFSQKDKTNLNADDIQQFQNEIDSLKKVELENRKPKIYPFNPSFLTDYKGYQLGMSIEEIDRLLEHRAQGKYINSAKEFQEITKVSDSLLDKISPYFKFPDWVINRQQNKTVTFKSDYKTTAINSKDIVIKDINSATAEELKQINGIGDKLAQRIIKYRDRLGGFLINEQLYEVYYLDKEVANRVLKRFQVLNKPDINKFNINTASFKEVLSIVYIDYELTKKIFDYRDEVAELQSLEELKKIEGFPIEKFDRIALYLVAE